MRVEWLYELFRLETNTIVSSNLKTDWDLAFESAADGEHIIINTSKAMAIHKSNLAFADLLSADDLDWNYDAHSGNLDSTAFGNWEVDKLYLVDRGYDHAGAHQGYFKLILNNVNETQYSVSYGDLSATSFESTIITKNTEIVFSHYSFENGVVAIAPPNKKWDLVFTQYTHLFADPFTAYLVTGVLLNRYETSAGIITDKSFEEISYDNAINLDLKTDLNTIGYDWKWFDFGAGTYLVDPTLIYIIKTSEGFYYKFHFTDFYNDEGIKGYPKFEFEQL